MGRRNGLTSVPAAGRLRAGVREATVAVRELAKNLAQFIPVSVLESLANYAVLRAAPELVPAQSVAGVAKAAYFEQVHDHLGYERPLLSLEFGVYRGRSLERWTRIDQHPDSRFVGFDSFTGLPERWRRRSPGYFSVGGELPSIDDPRVSFVTGWFNEALPDWLDGRQLNTEATTLVHIDADLYSSCSFLLATLHGELDDYFVLFDEFGAGEARALRDYVVAHNAEFTPLLGRQRRSYSRTPGQVFGRVITRRRITTRPACR